MGEKQPCLLHNTVTLQALNHTSGKRAVKQYGVF
jgi:hypothetical protein